MEPKPAASEAGSGQQEPALSTMCFCRLCQAVYRAPKLLPCLHSFCRPCLLGVVTPTPQGDGSSVTCPLCNHVTRLPAGGVAGLEDNVFLQRVCRQYVSQFQSHLAATSLQGSGHKRTDSSSSSEFSALRSRLSDEISHPRFSPLSSPRRRNTGSGGGEGPEEHVGEDRGRSRTSSVSSSHDMSEVFSPARSDRREQGVKDTEATLESIRNMSRLQSKVMSLQGEALRVTYAIDQVNSCMSEWQQHKEDLKHAIQRRTAQFQFFLKRVERQLLRQVDTKTADDRLYGQLDKSKVDLRTNLRGILHEVGVLKSMLEMGTEAEINQLSSALLGKSVGMSDVDVQTLEYELDVPGQNMEDMIAASFGQLVLKTGGRNVFVPEIIDFSKLPMDVSPSTPLEWDRFREPDLREERIELVSLGGGTGEEEEDDDDNDSGSGRSRRSQTSRRSSLRSSSSVSRGERGNVRRQSDLGLSQEDADRHLAQFHTAQETFRNRRREILRMGQQAREDASPLRNEAHRRRPRSTKRSIGRVQSLDRGSGGGNVVRNKMALPDLQGIMARGKGGNSASEDDEEEYEAETPADGASNPPRASLTSSKALFGVGASHHVHGPGGGEDISVPSPVLEEASVPSSPRRRSLGLTSNRKGRVSSPEEASGSEVTSPAYEFPRVSSFHSSTSSSRRQSAADTPPLSPTESTSSVASRGLDRASTRPIRRALSGASDKRSKMEFLRETWQRRKEILIQNEGFLSSDSSKTKPTEATTATTASTTATTTSPSISPTSQQASTSDISREKSSSNEGGGQLAPSPAFATDSRGGHMQQLKNKLSSLRQQITHRTSGTAAAQKSAAISTTEASQKLPGGGGRDEGEREGQGRGVSTPGGEQRKGERSPSYITDGITISSSLTSAATDKNKLPSTTGTSEMATTTSMECRVATKATTTSTNATGSSYRSMYGRYTGRYGVQSPVSTSTTTTPTPLQMVSASNNTADSSPTPATTATSASNRTYTSVYTGRYSRLYNSQPQTSTSVTATATTAITTSSATTSSNINSSSGYSSYTANLLSRRSRTSTTTPAMDPKQLIAAMYSGNRELLMGTTATTAATSTTSTPQTVTGANAGSSRSTSNALSSSAVRESGDDGGTSYSSLRAGRFETTSRTNSATARTDDSVARTSTESRDTQETQADLQSISAGSRLDHGRGAGNASTIHGRQVNPGNGLSSEIPGEASAVLLNRRHTMPVDPSLSMPATETTASRTFRGVMSSQKETIPETKPDTDEPASQGPQMRRAVPAPLHMVKQSSLDLPTDSSPTAPSPPMGTAGSPTTTSPTPGGPTAAGRLREIARKKKERWRHMTIN